MSSQGMLVPPTLVQALRNQRYHFVGRHSAVKGCKWLREALVHNRPCYKQKFYGIKSHRCIQMTPTLFYCTQQCLFCWRAQRDDLQVAWDEMKLPLWDSPEEIVDRTIRTQLAIVSGYKGNSQVDPQKLGESQTPRHAAISLTGEPTLYDDIGGLINAFHRRRFTTFLVSNGTVPSALSKLNEEPTQLYISVCAPNRGTLQRVCRPQIPNAWKKLSQTLSLLSSFKCSTAIRLTLVKNLNMNNIEGYAKLIEKAKPTHIEPKAYMHVGFSRLRLNYESTPSHEEIKMFGSRLAELTGYNFVDESEDSRVVLLSRFRKPVSIA